MGTPIGRHALVRLFSTILKREAQSISLSRRGEVVIGVDDAPFMAVDTGKSGEVDRIACRLRHNVDDWASRDVRAPARFEQAGDGRG